MAKANQFRLKFNKKAFEDLRQDPRAKRDLVERAERIKDAASKGGTVEGYVVTDLVLEDPRGAVSVMATGHAARHARKHNALIRNLDAGKG
mgnify:CR=1 FL=1